jgi:AraC-like DNA-binding protein
MCSMEKSLRNKICLGDNVTIVKQTELCTVYQMRDETGEGTMARYALFPGIDVMFNDFHMQACFSKFQPKVDMIGIDYCRHGRIEWEYQNACLYLQQGNLQINAKEHHTIGFGFPLNHYHGITVAIYVAEAETELADLLGGFPVDLHALREKYCAGKIPFILRGEEHIVRIFNEIYSAPEAAITDYLRLKVLELLLFLRDMDTGIADPNPAYFPKKRVSTIKEIKQYLTSHMDKRISQQELSRKFSIPLTSMKLCFKGVYGMSIYAFIRSYRIQAAARMLRESEETIGAIAGYVGYDNASKFASVFKTETGLSPSEYRTLAV